MFGRAAYTHILNAERRKFDKKAEKLRFVAYSKESKGYQIFDEKTREIITRRDIIFNEMEFGLSGIKAETEPVEPKEMIEVDPNSMVGSRM